MPRIFISYRRIDTRERTERIHDRLALKFGKDNVFLDVDRGIQPGDDFEQILKDKLSQSDVLVVVIGSKWLEEINKRLNDNKDFVRYEVQYGLAHPTILIIPVLIDDSQMPPQNALPESIQGLASKQGFWIRQNPDFQDDVTVLIQRLSEYFKTLEQPVIISSQSKSSLSRAGLIIGITILLAIIVIIVSRQPSQLPPAEIANQRLTQTAAFQIANLITQAAEGTISGIMTQFVTQTNQANATLTADTYTQTLTATLLPTETPTEDIYPTINAQATLDKQSTANIPTDTPQPTLTFTSTPTSTFMLTITPIPLIPPTSDFAVTQVAAQTQLAVAQQDARMTQAAQPTEIITSEIQGPQTPTLDPTFLLEAGYVTVLESANLRSGPATNYSIMGTAKKGEKFAVIARNSSQQDIWYLVAKNDGTAVWVSSKVASSNENFQNIQIAATIPPTPISVLTQSQSNSSASSQPVGGSKTINLTSLPITMNGVLTKTQTDFYTFVNDSISKNIVLTMSSNGTEVQCVVHFSSESFIVPEDARQQFLQTASTMVIRHVIIPNGTHTLRVSFLDYSTSICPSTLSYSFTVST